ncbi:hypothetical protein PsYK624_117170 [Phanerochaete sordida]|uniref:Uncharacterized protein n=1 Tax=Phanerochaete sordida TaxID=48140 RepID=A0A9P3LIU2_9APHY|nr:hypothetical protein PsYK624_117170 [Phanerochaete sordida]
MGLSTDKYLRVVHAVTFGDFDEIVDQAAFAYGPATIEVGYYVHSVPTSKSPRVRRINIDLLDGFSDLQVDFDAFEAALLDLDEVPVVHVHCVSPITDFKHLLDAVLHGKVFQRLHGAAKLRLQQGLTSTTMDAVMSTPAEYSVDGSAVVLSPLERVDYLALLALDKPVHEKETFLRNTLRSHQSLPQPENPS